MSIGQTVSLRQMAELAQVSLEQLQGWVDEGFVPVLHPEPDPVLPQIPRIDTNQVILVRALRDGTSIEEAKAEVLKNGRTGDTWKHRPPTQTEQEKLRERVAADRKRLFQELRNP